MLFQISSRKYPKLKEVDDVLGGAAAWENVDSTQGKDSQRTYIVLFKIVLISKQI